MSDRRFRRSNKNKMFFGVCGGIAEYFNRDVALIRLLWIAASLCTAVMPGIVCYLIFAVLMENPTKAV